ncbi:hypothetical protein WB890_001115 [Vibrio parahaemolyticus]
MEDNFNKIKSSLYTLFAGGVMTSTLGFLLSLILIKLYGSDNFGKFAIYQSYILIFASIFSLQSWQPLIEKLTNSNDELNSFMSFFVPEFFLGLIALFISYFSQDLIFSFFRFDDIKPFSLLALTPIVFLQQSSFFGLFRHKRKHLVVNLLQIVNISLLILLSVLIYFMDKNVNDLIRVSYVAYFIPFLLSIAFTTLLLRVNDCNIRTKSLDIKSSFRKSFPFMITSMADIPIRDMTLFLVNKYCGVEVTSFYRILLQFSSLLGKVSIPIYQASYPELVNINKFGEKSDFYRVIKKIIIYSSFLMLPIFLALTASYNFWVGAFFSENYVDYHYEFSFFIFSYTLAGIFMVIHPVFVIKCNHILMVLTTLFANIVYVLLVLMLAPEFKIWGILFALFAQIITVIVIKLLIILRSDYENIVN